MVLLLFFIPETAATQKWKGQIDSNWTRYSFAEPRIDLYNISVQKQLQKESTKEYNLRRLEMERDRIREVREIEFKERMKEEREIRRSQD